MQFDQKTISLKPATIKSEFQLLSLQQSQCTNMIFFANLSN